MKVISTNFSSPRGRGTAGLFLGLFFLVALAPMGTTLTHVLAADSDIEGPKGLRGASMQAAGAAIGGEASHASEQKDSSGKDVRTSRNSSQDAGVKERVQAPSPASSSSSSTVISSSQATTPVRHGSDGVRVVSEVSAGPHEDEVDKGQLPSSFSPVSAVTTLKPASDSEGIVQARSVRDASAREPAEPDGSEEKVESPLPGVPGSGPIERATQEPGVHGKAAAAGLDALAQDNTNSKNPALAGKEENKRDQAESPFVAAVPGGALGQRGGGDVPSEDSDQTHGSSDIVSSPSLGAGGVENSNGQVGNPKPGAGPDGSSGPGAEGSGDHKEEVGDVNQPEGDPGKHESSEQSQGGGGGSGSSGTNQRNGQGQNNPNPESQQGNETSTVSPSSSTAAPTTTTSSSTTYQKFWCAIIGLLTVVPFLMAT